MVDNTCGQSIEEITDRCCSFLLGEFVKHNCYLHSSGGGTEARTTTFLNKYSFVPNLWAYSLSYQVCRPNVFCSPIGWQSLSTYSGPIHLTQDPFSSLPPTQKLSGSQTLPENLKTTAVRVYKYRTMHNTLRRWDTYTVILHTSLGLRLTEFNGINMS